MVRSFILLFILSFSLSIQAQRPYNAHGIDSLYFLHTGIDLVMDSVITISETARDYTVKPGEILRVNAAVHEYAESRFGFTEVYMYFSMDGFKKPYVSLDPCDCEDNELEYQFEVFEKDEYWVVSIPSILFGKIIDIDFRALEEQPYPRKLKHYYELFNSGTYNIFAASLDI